MPETNHELVMENTHGRRDKCKTEFKAVVNKILISGLVIATVVGSTIAPAYASGLSMAEQSMLEQGVRINQNYGVSVESALYEINATIDAINSMKKKGTVSDKVLKSLASQLYSLQTAMQNSSNYNVGRISAILDRAEQVVQGIDKNNDVGIAITIVRTFMGIEKEEEIKEEKVESVVIKNNNAAPMVKSFSDVTPGAWYYNSVMAMTEKGYFAGKGNIVNGVGKFSPDDTMTKAEFLTVVARMLFDEDSITKPSNEPWWSGYYRVLLDNKVISGKDVSVSTIEQNMTREEMAMVAIKVLEYKGENFDDLYIYNIEKSIPDMLQVNGIYRDSVVKAYGKGILVGVNDSGTYNPQGTLKRAEATQVLYRIIDSSQRNPKDFSTITTPQSNRTQNGFLKRDPDNGFAVPEELVNSDTTAPITIYEGQPRQNRPAKEGDTFVKADGTQIILKKDQYGVVGGGQGVAPDIGLYYNGPKVTAGWQFHHGGANLDGPEHKYQGVINGSLWWVDSFGNRVNNQDYCVNNTTGEGHWEFELTRIVRAIGMPSYDGTFDGEVSKDPYAFWVWYGQWVYNCK